MHLGKVFVHPRTWEVLGVEHNDFKFPASIIRSDEMMYFTIRDHNLSPGTLHYGYSLVERVVDLSELNRINNQRNLKEINYRMWAAFLLIRLVGSYNEKTMRKVKDQIAKGAGNSIMVNQQVTVEVHRVVHDMVQLLDERKENYRETIRQMQVPIILFDPDILNRATSQELMEAWTASVLRNYRSWLKDIIQDQWINPIVKELIEADRRPSIGQQEEEQPPLIQEGPNTSSSPNLNEEKEETSTRTSNRDIVPIEAINPQTNEVHVYRLPWKIKIEFAPLNYDTFKERAEMAILLKNNGMATIRTGLKLMGIEDEEEIAALVELEEKRQEQRFSQGQQPFPQENRQRSLERQRETMKQELQKSVTGQNVPSKGIIRPSRTAPEE